MLWEYRLECPIFFKNVPLDDNIKQLPDEIQMSIYSFLKQSIQQKNFLKNNISTKKNFFKKSVMKRDPEITLYRKICSRHDLFLFKYVLKYE